ncbi:MAG: hypothetical protein CMJ78_04075 [Planctomycetaceae bacterium]|nr:hypothetical protein [Planctomycetaceae bacterium]
MERLESCIDSVAITVETAYEQIEQKDAAGCAKVESELLTLTKDLDQARAHAFEEFVDHVDYWEEVITKVRHKVRDSKVVTIQRKNARATFTVFIQDGLEQTRYHTARISGESRIFTAREARKTALAALSLYGLEDLGQLQSDQSVASGVIDFLMSPETYTGPPESALFVNGLDETQRQDLRNSIFEIMWTLGDSEATAYSQASKDEKKEAQERSLAWLSVAKRLHATHSYALSTRKANVLASRGRVEEAADARKGIVGIPETALDQYLMAEIKRHEGRYEEAQRLYQATLRLQPDHFWARYPVGPCSLEQLEPRAAVAAFDICVEARPDSTTALLGRALADFDAEKLDDAFADLDSIFKLDPNHYGAWLNRGYLHAKQGKLDEALSDFSQAAELNSERSASFLNRGEVHSDKATAALKKNPPDRDTALAEWNLALKDYSQAIKLSPTDCRPYLYRGDVWAKAGKFQSAIADYREAVKHEGTNADIAKAYRNMGRLQHGLSNFGEAMFSWDSYLKLFPKDAEVLSLRADTARRLGRHQAVIESLSKYFSQREPLSKQIDDRGRAFSALGLIREAHGDFTRAIEKSPTAELLNRRGWMMNLYAYQIAELDFIEAIEGLPLDPNNFSGRSYARVMQGKYREGVADAAKSASLITENIRKNTRQVWPLYINIADIYAQASLQVQDDETSQAERTQLQEEYQAKALQFIKQTISSAKTDKAKELAIEALKKASALRPIRQTREFREFIASLQSDPEACYQKTTNIIFCISSITYAARIAWHVTL